MDPGVKTWIVAVRQSRDLHETNIKVSHKEYYDKINNYSRTTKGKKITARFEEEARRDREDRDIYEYTPSPKGKQRNPYYMHTTHKTKWWNLYLSFQLYICITH